ncbi:testis development-related protein [Gadus chalcogrammus]|uniref:testis development-related protein n=1 Tax=Gadus chalcogrammus TaxID=1042646 RepID=UPI0024C4D0C9|nr:testis development-related protein [Gadus chalcogrammus]
MFKKSRSKVLVDDASEEDDMSWHYDHCYKDKDIEGVGEEEEEQEEAASTGSQEAKVKKTKSKKEKREKKMFSFKDDEHFLLTGIKLSDRRGSHKIMKEDEKETEKGKKPEKNSCFWESITMTMRQVTPTKKLEKMEGWEPPQLSDGNDKPIEDVVQEAVSKTRDTPVSLPRSLELPLGLHSWRGLGLEEDSSRYANLSDSTETSAARWTALAKVKLAGIRRSRGIVSENSWKGFK